MPIKKPDLLRLFMPIFRSTNKYESKPKAAASVPPRFEDINTTNMVTNNPPYLTQVDLLHNNKGKK